MPGQPISSRSPWVDVDKRAPKCTRCTKLKDLSPPVCLDLLFHAGSITMRPTACTPVTAGNALLRSGLLQLLLLASLACIASGTVGELRCRCLKTVQRIHPKILASLEVIRAGPQCPRNEVIATLRKGGEICLDPEAPWVKKFVPRYLNNQAAPLIYLSGTEKRLVK